MEANLARQGFQAGELERIDRALARLPSGHVLAPRGLRHLHRAPALTRAGRAYPSVLAMFARSGQSAYVFDAAFAHGVRGGHPGPSTDLVVLAVQLLVGCSLSCDRGLYAEFSRHVGRKDQPAALLLLEETALARAMGTASGERSGAVDLLAVPPGVDLGVAYALFLSQPRALESAAPNVYAFLRDRVFAPEELVAVREDHETIDTQMVQLMRG
jgi:hypothetical protein